MKGYSKDAPYAVYQGFHLRSSPKVSREVLDAICEYEYGFGYEKLDYYRGEGSKMIIDRLALSIMPYLKKRYITSGD